LVTISTFYIVRSFRDVMKPTHLKGGEDMTKDLEVLGRFDHDSGVSSSGQLEDDLRIRETVELGHQLDDNGGPGLGAEEGDVPVSNDSPDKVLLRQFRIKCFLIF
jgi:hypothetical protein